MPITTMEVFEATRNVTPKQQAEILLYFNEKQNLINTINQHIVDMVPISGHIEGLERVEEVLLLKSILKSI